MVNNLPATAENVSWICGREDPLEKEIATHCSVLAWEMDQRSLVGCSPWGHAESDTTERFRSSSSTYIKCLFISVYHPMA